jgi:hypothetical protein
MGPITMESLCFYLINSKFDFENILICQTGWKQWKKALEVPEFINQKQKMLVDLEDSLPPIEESPVAEEIPPFIPQIVPIEKKENRVHPRAIIELKVVFITGNKSFRTKTKNVSLGGLKIVDPLPGYYFGKLVEIYLSSPDQKFFIKLKATILENEKSLTHIKFQSKNDIGFKHLSSWLESATNQYIKKSA